MAVLIRTANNMYVSAIRLRTGDEPEGKWIDYEPGDGVPGDGDVSNDTISAVMLSRDTGKVFRSPVFAQRIIDEAVPEAELLTVEGT